MVSLVEQLSAFGLTIVGGMLMGIVFDVFRVVRNGVGSRGPLGALLDILYWLLVTPLILGLLWRANHGELRFYVVLGVGIGSLLYNTLFSAFILETLSALWHTVGRIIGWIIHTAFIIVTWPIMIVRGIVLAWTSRRPVKPRRALPFIGRAAASGAAPGRRRSLFPLTWRPALAWRRR